MWILYLQDISILWHCLQTTQLNYGAKIILTGTPIENNWEELWSLFNIINTGYLGHDINDFKRKYLKIDKNGRVEPDKNLFKRIFWFFIRPIFDFFLTRNLKTFLTKVMPISDCVSKNRNFRPTPKNRARGAF